MHQMFETALPSGFIRALLLVYVSLLLATVSAQQVTISKVLLQMNRPQVSQLETVEVQLTRSVSRSAFVWQTDHCYELYVGSPYKNAGEYVPFSAARTPVCSSITTGVEVACSVRSDNVMRFSFSSLSDLVKNRQEISFTFTNFQTPYSSQTLEDMELRYYGDSACSQAKLTKSIPKVQIEAAFLPPNAIAISSSIKVIASVDPKNTLTVSFTPQTTMSPSGSGKIEIGIPEWYNVEGTSELMYNPEALNQCSSSCMTIRSSILQGQYLNILYDSMKVSCITGRVIVIECAQFYNPIYQDKWYGFYINTYDNEAPFYKAIEKSSTQNFLDTNDYEPHPIPVAGFIATPEDLVVNSPSGWEFVLDPGLPMGIECSIQLFMPADLKIVVDYFQVTGIFTGISLNSFLSKDEVEIVEGDEIDPRKSIIFPGCHDSNYLGLSPFGTLVFRTVYTQRSIKDSDQFDIIIYKDLISQKKIAQLQPGNYIPASILQSGTLEDLAVYPLVYQVQQSSLLYVNFTTQSDIFVGAKVTIQLPSDLKLPQRGTNLNLFRLSTDSSGAELSMDAKFATVLANNEIQIIDFITTKDRQAPYKFRFAIEGIQNQRSSRDAGGFTIQTFDRIDAMYYLIDTQTATSSFVATPGYIIASGQILIDSATNYRDNSVYTLVFTAPSAIPTNGFMHIRFPSEITINRSKSVQLGVCKVHTCHYIDSHWLQIRFSLTTLKDEQLKIEIGGIKNPRTFQPTGSFQIETYDIDGVSKIDQGFNMNTQMTIGGTITEFSLQRKNETNGARTTYEFTVKTDIPIQVNDVLHFKIPAQIRVNYEGPEASSRQLKSTALPYATECSSTDQIVCGITGQEVNIQVVSLASQYEFSWSMSNMGNPISTAPSDGFSEIKLLTQDQFLVSELKSASAAPVTNTIPANLQQYQIQQRSDQAGADAPYLLEFTPINAIPSTGSIKIQYPKQIMPTQGNKTLCLVTTYNVMNDKCTIDTDARTIVIRGAFLLSKSYKSEITIKLINVTNPIDNRPASGFTITTYADADQLYVIDRVTNQMVPQLACDYPCATCDLNSRTNCSSCWLHDFQLPNYLMSFPDVLSGRCLDKCNFGFTSNGTANLRCTQCDSSCDGCEDKGKPGDTKQCLKCSKTAPYRLENTKFCLPSCQEGVFLIKEESTCGVCNAPCKTCFGDRDSCTSCDPGSSLPNLHNNKCIQTCPDGTISIAGVCESCKSPCKTCAGSPKICTSCDQTENRDVLFSGSCFDVCPRGYVTNKATKECVGCLPGCDLCLLSNTTHCEQCGENLVAYEGSCIGSCPDGLRPSEGKCVEPSSFDLILMYFPFLIASALFTCVVLAGKLKKKPTLVEGKLQNINTQKSVVAINAFIAPLQTLSTILMLVLCIYQGHKILFAMTVGVFSAMVIFNWAFLVWFIRNFYSKFAPKVGTQILIDRKIILITKKNRHRYEQDRDTEFKAFVGKHRISTLIVFALIGGCHFNTFKLTYSHFYMFDMFKAKWTRATYLRTALYKWQLSYICAVHLTLIGICAYGLVTLPFRIDQLFIVMLEVILLTLLIMCLQLYELTKLKGILRYTEQKLFFAKTKNMQRLKSKIQMVDFQKENSRKNTNYFNEKKLSELLGLFGSRSCKSAEDLQHGFKNVQDDRRVVTWPCSPDLEEEINQMDLKFTAQDAYDVYDNVYAEGVAPPLVKHINIQAGEPGRRDFQEALDRKQNEILTMSQLEPVGELQKMRTARRRGRQNKYYDAIEVEDGTNEQQEDQDQTYQRLIQQQEEEEIMLKALISPDEIELATQRKLRREAEKHKLREAQLQAQLRLQQERDARARQEFEAAEQARLLEEEKARRRLQQEAERVRAEQEAREAEELRRQIEESFLERQRYEEQERLRLKAEQIERERLAQLAEEARQRRLEEERLAREAETRKLEAERLEKERQRIEEVRLMQEQQELLRAKQRAIEQAEKERVLRERREREEAQRLEAVRLEEEARREKELAKAREVQKRQAERAALKLEQEERAEQDRLQKQLRRQQEEIRLKGQHDEKIAAREAREVERRAEETRAEIRQAANVYARNLSYRVAAEEPIEPPIKTTAVKHSHSKTLTQSELQKQYSVKDITPAPTVELVNQQTLLNNSSGAQQDLPAVKQRSVLHEPPRPLLRTVVSQSESVHDHMNTTYVAVNQDFKKDFDRKTMVQCPPDPETRVFNEHDVLGDVERDEKANVILQEDRDGQKHDRQGEPCNQRGYLIDPHTGDVIENMHGRVMFYRADLDFKGELPAPFSLEKYNFNPHLISGDFDYSNGRPLVMQTAKGAYVDKQGRRVNENGWYVIPGHHHLVDNVQRKKFDKRQLVGAKFDDLPRLYNYEGKRFNIRDVMGEFEKDSQGNIIPIAGKDGSTRVDLLGRLVNPKGYLIDGSGNIIDCRGRQIWKASELKSGEFIKIFPFSKFNISTIIGDIQVSRNGEPVLDKTANGDFVDRRSRLINTRGYLIDRRGNIIDQNGKTVFDAAVISADGEIPKVFRTGVLHQDSDSSISRLMSEIEREVHNPTVGVNDRDSGYEALPPVDKKDDTSVDSKMDDTPANYNIANQRYEFAVDADVARPSMPDELYDDELDLGDSEFSSEGASGMVPAVVFNRKKTKAGKKKKLKTIEVLPPTEKQKNMAGVYGGEPKPEIRRPKVKYDKERLKGGKKFRVTTANEPRVKAHLTSLGQNSTGSALDMTKHVPRKQGLMGDSVHHRPKKSTIQVQEPDFEQVYGKDIDQFLDDSEWDIDNMAIEKQSSDDVQHRVTRDLQLHKKSNESEVFQNKSPQTSGRKLKKEPSPPRKSGGPSPLRQDTSAKRLQQQRQVVGPPRETIMNVTDDPRVLHRGEILEFETRLK